MSYLEDLKNNQQLRQISVDGSAVSNFPLIDLYSSFLFKADSALYQSFDVVWHDNKGFGKATNWRTVLNEMIRLIGKTGILVFSIDSEGDDKFCEDYQRIMANVKMYLFRKVGLKCEVEYEDPKIYLYHARSQNMEVGKKLKIVIKVERTNIEIYQDRLWTFSIITDGKKVENVVNFCSSIREIDRESKHEILICGPYDQAYEQFNVRYIDCTKYRHEYAEICKKKNDIAIAASNQNLLIAHDRFVIEKDFLDGFDKFGYDFEFLSPRVVDRNYQDQSYWYLLGKNIFDNRILTFGDFFDASTIRVFNKNDFNENSDLSYSFLAGGCLIFKRDILRQLKFNDLIFWHQIEDWEISFHFINNGALPQTNLFSSVMDVRKIECLEVNKSESVLNKNKRSAWNKIKRSTAKRMMKLAINFFTNSR